MAKKYLDYDGVLYLWQKIKTMFVPTSRTINTKALSADVTLSAGDVGAAPTNHASAQTTYGSGTVANYGHVKLSDATSSTDAAAAGGTAATPKAVKDALDAAKAYADGLDSGVSDVQVDGDSVVTAGVAAIPKATGSQFGVVEVTAHGDAPGGYAEITDASGTIQLPFVNISSGTVTNTIRSKFLPEASAYDKGAMSAADKVKLDSLSGLPLFYGSTIAPYPGSQDEASTATIADFVLQTGTAVILNVAKGLKSTLNISDTGAKPVLMNGTQISAKSYWTKILLVYDGTNYNVIAADTGTKNVGVYNAGVLPPTGSVTESGEYKIYAGFDNQWKTVTAYFEPTSDAPPKSSTVAAVLNQKLNASLVGAASGVCPLNASSKIDSTYLPSYIDDVIEAYPISGATELSAGWLSETSGGTAFTPESGKIYILMADSTSYDANSQFRWSGSAYVKLADGGVSSITNAEIDTIVAS